MPTRTASAFRLNLEQQKKRAKELLRAARAGDPGALARLEAHRPSPAAAARPAGAWKLADAQRSLARELRFASWAHLTAHAAAMQRQLKAITTGAPAPDAGVATLHVRCGTDIEPTLRQAGFTGDFLEHALPYYSGPVSLGPERHERMARFLVEAFPQAHSGLLYERVLAELEEAERALTDSTKYERVVLWMEHDPWDQLILARLLAAYALAAPQTLELVQVNEFPGAKRFLGLGELPPEALRALWATRRPVTPAQLSLGQELWQGLCASHPQHLAALARSGTPALPAMALALRRHLQELPWTRDGLSLTQRLILQTAAHRKLSLNQIFWELQQRDPLPSITDLSLLQIVNELLQAAEPAVLCKLCKAGPRENFAQPLTIAPAGLAVLAGERDFASLGPRPWWVGGVRATPEPGTWRWDEANLGVVLHG